MNISSITSSALAQVSQAGAAGKAMSNIAEEASEPMSVTKMEAQKGDVQARRKLSMEQISNPSSNNPAPSSSGKLNIQA